MTGDSNKVIINSFAAIAMKVIVSVKMDCTTAFDKDAYMGCYVQVDTPNVVVGGDTYIGISEESELKVPRLSGEVNTGSLQANTTSCFSIPMAKPSVRFRMYVGPYSLGYFNGNMSVYYLIDNSLV